MFTQSWSRSTEHKWTYNWKMDNGLSLYCYIQVQSHDLQTHKLQNKHSNLPTLCLLLQKIQINAWLLGSVFVSHSNSMCLLVVKRENYCEVWLISCQHLPIFLPLPYLSHRTYNLFLLLLRGKYWLFLTRVIDFDITVFKCNRWTLIGD